MQLLYDCLPPCYVRCKGDWEWFWIEEFFDDEEHHCYYYYVGNIVHLMVYATGKLNESWCNCYGVNPCVSIKGSVVTLCTDVIFREYPGIYMIDVYLKVFKF